MKKFLICIVALLIFTSCNYIDDNFDDTKGTKDTCTEENVEETKSDFKYDMSSCRPEKVEYSRLDIDGFFQPNKSSIDRIVYCCYSVFDFEHCLNTNSLDMSDYIKEPYLLGGWSSENLKMINGHILKQYCSVNEMFDTDFDKAGVVKYVSFRWRSDELDIELFTSLNSGISNENIVITQTYNPDYFAGRSTADYYNAYLKSEAGRWNQDYGKTYKLVRYGEKDIMYSYVDGQPYEAQIVVGGYVIKIQIPKEKNYLVSISDENLSPVLAVFSDDESTVLHAVELIENCVGGIEYINISQGETVDTNVN